MVDDERMKKIHIQLVLLPALLCAANLFAQTNAAPLPPLKLHPALLPALRSKTNWLGRHEGFVAQAKQGGVDILFLGDSITDYWRDRGSNVWNKYYAPRRAANFGIGGDRTQHVLWRIEHGELDGIKPKVTVLMIGTNNSGDDSAEDIATADQLIVQEIRARCPGTKVLLRAIFPRGPRKNSNGTRDDGIKHMAVIHAVNEQLAKLEDGRNICYLDIGPKFLGPDGRIPDNVMPDHLHPNEHGYQIWADAMNPTLEEMLK